MIFKKCKICNWNDEQCKNWLMELLKLSDADIRKLCMNHHLTFLKIQPILEKQRVILVDAIDAELEKRKLHQ